jgi:hypothetical protein
MELLWAMKAPGKPTFPVREMQRNVFVKVEMELDRGWPTQ